MVGARIPSISGDTRLTYLAEGAANIVYRFEIRHPTPPPSQLEEYGEGTPPPTEIECDFDEKGDGFERSGVFESTVVSHLYSSSFRGRALPLFSPVPCHTSGINTNVTLDKLLRLRKELPTTLPVSVTQQAWERVIAPLFLPSEIVQQSLVRLEPRVIRDLNTKLRQWEQDPANVKHSRSISRRGIYLADDEFGLLVTDMTAGT